MNPSRRLALSALAAGAALALGACSRDEPAADAGQRILELAQNAQGMRIGRETANGLVYVFFDPACPHCAHMWREARQLTAHVGQVWIPVAVLRGSSPEVATALLGASDPVAALDAHAAAVLERRAAHAGSPDTALNAATQRNGELFRKTQSDSVPLMVHRQPTTGRLVTNAGFLPAADLVRVLGLTASPSAATA